MKNSNLRTFLCETLVNQDFKDKKVRIFDITLFSLITLSIIFLVLETDQAINSLYQHIFYWFELFSVSVFTLEFIIRMWCCTCDNRYSHPIYGRIKYFFSPLMLIDFIAIAPFYIPVLNQNLLFLRLFRLFKIIFRLLKLSKHTPGIKIFIRAVNKTKSELGLAFILFFIVVVGTATIVYFIEKEVQPEVFTSIPKSLYWAIISFTTVGYGDIYPITSLGQFIASLSGILGVIIFAVPTAILSSALVEEIQNNKVHYTCTKCQKNLCEVFTGKFIAEIQSKNVNIFCPFCGQEKIQIVEIRKIENM